MVLEVVGATRLAVPNRDAAESSLTFLGFLVMKNVLKLESAPVITLLRNAGVRPVMVTGGTAMGGQEWGREGARRGCGVLAAWVGGEDPLGGGVGAVGLRVMGLWVRGRGFGVRGWVLGLEAEVRD